MDKYLTPPSGPPNCCFLVKIHSLILSSKLSKMGFCELCCAEYKKVNKHNKSKSHVGGVTHRCDECNKGFSSAPALKRHYRLASTLCTDINFCKLCWKDCFDIRSHAQTNDHLRGVKFNCRDCGIGLSGFQALKRHYDKSTCAGPPTISQYRCCDCDLDYSSLDALCLHLEDENIHPPRAVKAVNLSLFCGECDKEFKTQEGLKSHLATSIKHNPLCEPFRCIGGKGCRKLCYSPSQMLSHLESGTCKSGITWEKLDQLMIENDTTNIIIEPDAFATRAAYREKILLALDFDDSSSIVSTDGGVGILTPTSIEDSSRSNSITSSGGYRPNFPLTPSEHSEDSDVEGSQATITRRASIGSDDLDFDFNPRPGFTRHDSISSISSQALSLTPTGLLTPQSESNASGVLILPEMEYSCPLCPEQKKKFKTRQGLQAHMESQAHASKIYHCPISFLLDIDGLDIAGSGKKSLKMKKFKTLSGVTRHVEVGACAGGKEGLVAVVGFVNEKLKAFELGDMTLVQRVQEA